MSGPIHFVDVTGALQELGPGARIQFNGRDGTRREIILVHPDSLRDLRSSIRSELTDVEQRLSDKIRSNRLFSGANEATIEALSRLVADNKLDLEKNDRWAIARTSSLSDRTCTVEEGILLYCFKLERIAIVGVAGAAISLILAIISFFV